MKASQNGITGSQPNSPEDEDKTQRGTQDFRLLVDSIKDYAIFMIDAQGIVVTWNKGAEKIKGYTSAEIIGKHISVFYTATEIEQGIPASNLAKAASFGSYESESIRVRKDGTLFWADVVFTALRNVDGSLRGFAKVTRDITERKIAENKLSYLANLLKKTSDAIFSYGIDYNLLSWNKAAEVMFGYTAEEVLEKNAAAVLQTIIDDCQRQKIREEFSNKKKWAGEVVYRRKDGTPLPVYISITATESEAEDKEEYVCVCRDISEQKRAEGEAKALQGEIDRLTREKLQTSEKEIADYKYALDKSSIVAITDQKGTINYVNDNFCAISKYSRHELLGQDHRVINSGHHPKEFIRNLWVTIANGGVWKGELKNKAKDGTYYWVDTTIVPFLNDQGKPIKYIAIRADITERKRAEEALTLLNDQLEDRIKSRTRDLQIANKELESFSYSVSHDLRAPLRGVSGFARILQEDYGHLMDEEGKRIINKIIAGAGTMGRLIDDLLTFSRTGRKEIVGCPINMKILVDDCLKELAMGLERVKYAVEVKPLPNCVGDASLIKQVWLNLLGNAIKYSSKKEAPLITVGGNENATGLVYFVKDNGAGFDVQYSSKLFGVFQRLHGMDEFPGTGVGLALVKLIISKHHGEVWADGSPGKGATFYFGLPKKALS